MNLTMRRVFPVIRYATCTSLENKMTKYIFLAIAQSEFIITSKPKQLYTAELFEQCFANFKVPQFSNTKLQ